ncbi:MAG: hypothetical protein D6725_07120 [Planctomycetota bacterium]|nr:MAG: hypothetical protein D6725_07120 [Planctomycetota bacterium]
MRPPNRQYWRGAGFGRPERKFSGSQRCSRKPQVRTKWKAFPMRRLKLSAACAAALVAQWSSGLRADTGTGQRPDVVCITAHDAVAFVKAARAGGMASGQQATLPASAHRSGHARSDGDRHASAIPPGA